MDRVITAPKCGSVDIYISGINSPDSKDRRIDID